MAVASPVDQRQATESGNPPVADALMRSARFQQAIGGMIWAGLTVNMPNPPKDRIVPGMWSLSWVNLTSGQARVVIHVHDPYIQIVAGEILKAYCNVFMGVEFVDHDVQNQYIIRLTRDKATA